MQLHLCSTRRGDYEKEEVAQQAVNAEERLWLNKIWKWQGVV